MADPDAALRELGALVVAAARHGCPALNKELAPVLDRLDLAYDDGPGVAVAALKVALGITEEAATAAGGGLAMAIDMTLHPVGTCEDAFGDEIEISVITGGEFGDDQETAAVYVAGFTLDTAGREEFQRLFMEAERRAEQAIANAAPLTDLCAYHGGEGSGHPGCPGCQEDEDAATAAGEGIGNA